MRWKANAKRASPHASLASPLGHVPNLPTHSRPQGTTVFLNLTYIHTIYIGFQGKGLGRIHHIIVIYTLLRIIVTPLI